ncbi:MAG: chorismate mutase [Firmicutes bacterium]|nr:chorismate mutase [Bacillota bacterium]
MRGVRGAISVQANENHMILESTGQMISAALELNHIQPEDIAAIMFAVTPDLDKAFPAAAARGMGLTGVPLLDFVSPDVEAGMRRVIRMLLLWNTDKNQDEVRHVYLGEAQRLRSDLASPG